MGTGSTGVTESVQIQKLQTQIEKIIEKLDDIDEDLKGTDKKKAKELGEMEGQARVIKETLIKAVKTAKNIQEKSSANGKWVISGNPLKGVARLSLVEDTETQESSPAKKLLAAIDMLPKDLLDQNVDEGEEGGNSDIIFDSTTKELVQKLQELSSGMTSVDEDETAGAASAAAKAAAEEAAAAAAAAKEAAEAEAKEAAAKETAEAEAKEAAAAKAAEEKGDRMQRARFAKTQKQMLETLAQRSPSADLL